jgi:hypothetical protein
MTGSAKQSICPLAARWIASAFALRASVDSQPCEACGASGEGSPLRPPRNDRERFRFNCQTAMRVSDRIPATRFRPGFANSLLPLSDRGRRESRAPTAPAVPCAKSATEMHTGLTTGTAETSRLSPRNGFTAYTCSPRGSGLSCPRCQRETLANVAPGSRRQDHTTSPYAAFFRPAAGLDAFRKSSRYA